MLLLKSNEYTVNREIFLSQLFNIFSQIPLSYVLTVQLTTVQRLTGKTHLLNVDPVWWITMSSQCLDWIGLCKSARGLIKVDNNNDFIPQKLSQKLEDTITHPYPDLR